MIKRKLLIGLTAAGLFLAGFGGLSTGPASASTRYVVTLASGETIEVDVPEGQTVEQVVGGPVVSATPKAEPAEARRPGPRAGARAAPRRAHAAGDRHRRARDARQARRAGRLAPDADRAAPGRRRREAAADHRPGQGQGSIQG